MDLLVLELSLVLLEEFGMFLLIAVNVLKLLIGMDSNVKYYLNVQEGKSLIVIMNVHAHKALFGQVIYAYILPVMEGKFGLVPNVFVLLV